MAKRTRKKCVVCGKNFLTENAKKKCCSKSCRAELYDKHATTRGQLCWSCKKATGFCSWSVAFKPVPGWTAKPTQLKDSDGHITHSYKITACPEFEHSRNGRF